LQITLFIILLVLLYQMVNKKMTTGQLKHENICDCSYD